MNKQLGFGHTEQYFGTDLVRVLEKSGVSNVLKEQKSQVNTPLLKGKLSFDTLPSGFRVHCTDVKETREGESCAEITPGISINVLIKGMIDYAMGDRTYHFCAASKPLLFINVINEPQVFTRYLKRNQSVKKVNISIDKYWLLNRCDSDEDIASVESIFAHQHQVYQWPCVHELVELAEELIQHNVRSKVEDRLLAEQKAFSLFSQGFVLLKQENKPLVTPTKKINSIINISTTKITRRSASRSINENPNKKTKANPHFESLILDRLDEPMSLHQIADRLGASVSTIQRYFKANHQVTVIEFIRHKKLERARQGLLIEGLSIGEVAYEAGYNHVSNFVTAFKKHFCITPTELKKQYFINEG